MLQASRAEVYNLIDGEREYQEARWPGSSNDLLTVGDTILLLEEYVQRAREQWVGEAAPEVNAMDMVRKVAAIAVRGMEYHLTPRRVQLGQ